jgi:hypothetical protein
MLLVARALALASSLAAFGGSTPRVVALATLLAACGGAPAESSSTTATNAASSANGCSAAMPPTRSISCVESFSPGKGAGYGEEDFPEVVFGHPVGGGDKQGSLDVLSLGRGGEIVVGFGANDIVDGDGVDFIVFENAFYVGGNVDRPFKELGEISVSADGEDWTVFPCDPGGPTLAGCAGWHPVYANDELEISPFDPKVAGGDAFDLAEIGVARARFVRIRDVGQVAAAPNAGFDLDALAIVHAEVEAK